LILLLERDIYRRLERFQTTGARQMKHSMSSHSSYDPEIGQGEFDTPRDIGRHGFIEVKRLIGLKVVRTDGADVRLEEL
jgi:hypothetical protein